jgi:hypothetical protein
VARIAKPSNMNLHQIDRRRFNRDNRSVEAVSPLLSLGLTQLSIQVTLSASLTASALGLAALATALTSTILTVQGALAPHWQWTLLPSVAGTVTGLLATAAVGAEDIGREEVYEAHDITGISSTDCGMAVLHTIRSASLANARTLKRKDRLTSLTLACVASTILLVGVLNLASVLG